jgi:hypothetical protein
MIDSGCNKSPTILSFAHEVILSKNNNFTTHSFHASHCHFHSGAEGSKLAMAETYQKPTPRVPKSASKLAELQVQDRRREFLRRHPSYFNSTEHELAGKCGKNACLFLLVRFPIALSPIVVSRLNVTAAPFSDSRVFHFTRVFTFVAFLF